MKIRPAISFLIVLTLAVTAGIAGTSEPLPLESLAIPESLGKIEAKFIGPTGRWVIHIQDVHAHLTAQQNIEALVEHLQEVYGIKTVALEGGWSATSLPKSWGLPPSRGKQAVAQALLEQDYITGPVYAAIFSKMPLRLVGIEDPRLYEQNRQLYLKFLDSRDTTLQKLSVLDKKIQALKENLYNPDLLNFDKSLTDFRSGKKAEKFIPAALALAAAKEIKLGDLSQIATFQKALEIEKAIDRTKLEEEAKRLLASYKYSGLHFEELLKSGKIPADKLEFYPHVQKYLELMKIQDQISHREFFEQIETAIQRLKNKLLQTTDEINLDKRSGAFLLAQKIITLQATPSDLKAFDGLQTAAAADLQESGLEEALNNGMSFYETAKKRDQIFFEKITTDPKLSGNIAVVTGGFHTEGLSERFEKAGISYLVISPDLGKDEPVNESLYFERLRENLPASQALAELQDRYMQLERGGYEKSVAAFNSGDRNLTSAVNRTMSFQNGAPAEQKSAESSAQDLQADILSYHQSKVSHPSTTVIRQKDLEKLLSLEVAKRTWNEEILPNHQITYIVVREEGDAVFMDKIGRARIKVIPGTFKDILSDEIKKLKKDARLSVIHANYKTEDQRVAVLPVHPAALYITLLSPTRYNINTEFMDRVLAILQEIYNIQTTRAAA